MVASSSFVLLAVAIFAIGVNSQQGGQGGPEQPPSFLQGG
jgi:hypothetical protein